jgi:hypothetical protein
MSAHRSCGSARGGRGALCAHAAPVVPDLTIDPNAADMADLCRRWPERRCLLGSPAGDASERPAGRLYF